MTHPPTIPITAGLRIAARLGNSDLVLPVTERAAALANTPRPGPDGRLRVEVLVVEGVDWTLQGPVYRGHVVWVGVNGENGEGEGG